MIIVIISHTEHFINNNGDVVGWGPTVKEIDYLADYFGKVIHIACLHGKKNVPASAIPYKSRNVEFKAIPSYGGPGLKNKLKIIFTAPKIIYTVIKTFKNADAFQFRAPTTMGVYLIPLLSLISKKSGWFKYAGNWNQVSPPLAYFIQREWLKRLQKRKVTINGKWTDQPSHCLSFENPCLTFKDRKQGKQLMKKKEYRPPFNLCYAGRLETAKGVNRILTALEKYPTPKDFGTIHFAGDGKERSYFERRAHKLSYNIIFHGFCERETLFQIYKQSHFLLLPSDSEGFPKVIAEAANFGCVPIVSDISSIGQYINKQNGYLWRLDNQSFESFFNTIDFKNDQDIISKANEAYKMARTFTFEKYCWRLQNEILK